MTTLRNLFHKISNLHNKISIIAGVAKEFLTEQDIIIPKASEQKENISKVVKLLNQIEQDAIGVDKTITELKEFIYKTIGPDTEMPSDKKEEGS